MRDFEKSRHALDRAVKASLRSRAQAAGWKIVDNNLFRVRDDWFLHATWFVSKVDETTALQFHVKPLELDHVFWDIVGLPENKTLKISLRANGAWTTHPPALFEDTLVDSNCSPDAISQNIITWIEKSSEASLEHFSIELVAKRIENNIHWRERHSYSDALICAYVLAGRTEEAKELAKACALHGQPLDYIVGGQNFGARALEWIEAREADTAWKRAMHAVRRLFRRTAHPLPL